MAAILIIDDDESVRAAIRMVLETAGYMVVEADGGRKGLLFGKSQAFDLVICDILMPEFDGIETIRGLRNVSQKIKILAISGGGKTNPEIFLSMAQQLGADDTLMKPFGRTELLAHVEELLKKPSPNA
jgi:DNA-binding response OmpR family regulator